MKKINIISGRKSKKGRYKEIGITSLVSKVVEAVGCTFVDGAYGEEPCTILFFTDGTQHGFVHPRDDME